MGSPASYQLARVKNFKDKYFREKSSKIFILKNKSPYGITLTLSWGEPFNNLDPIVNYTVSCSGDVTYPPNFITTDNTTRSYTITKLTPMTNYTFSVVAANSIGSGEAGVVIVTTPVKYSISPQL